MITHNTEPRRNLLEMGAFQLLHMGNDQAATIMLEQLLAPDSRPLAVPFFRGLECYCYSCPNVKFCSKCRDLSPDSLPSGLYCIGHGFLEIPGKDWKNLREGTGNPEGQSFEGFLETLEQRVIRELEMPNKSSS